MTHYDFAVIGGGPAGSAAARRLAQKGGVVALFERRAMPRTKPCGGGLSVRAMAHLDFPIPPELVDNEIRGMRISFRGTAGEARLERLMGVLVTRSKFDHFMLKKAAEAGAQES